MTASATLTIIGRAPGSSIVLGVCLLVAAALAAAARAAIGERTDRAPSASTPGVLAGLDGRRVALGLAVAFVVLLFTHWVLLAAAAAVLTIGWGRIMHDRRADDERLRISAIATWLEDLRDTLRGSSVGAEEALDQAARRPPDAIREPMQQYLSRRRQGFRTEHALADLGDALAHPTSDAAIAAIGLVVSGGAGAGRLYHTVSALAVAARDEVRARERVDRTRAIYQSSMVRLVVIGAILVGYLRLAAADLLEPYGTPQGQLVLALPLAMWAGCIAWLRRLCRYDLPDRYEPSMTASGPRSERPAVWS